MKTLVLDAMGVMFSTADDVTDLLIPFIREHGGVAEAEFMRHAYLEASLGRMSSAQFWDAVGLDVADEDVYLARHVLMPGFHQFYEDVRPLAASICCLSNDVAEWASKLRRRFSLEPLFEYWFTSGEIGLRKPDPQIYRHMLEELRLPAKEVVFVDDRIANVDAAASLGLTSLHFCGDAASMLPIVIDALAAQ